MSNNCTWSRDHMTSLLRDYQSDAFFMSSPHRGMLAQQPVYNLTSADTALAVLAASSSSVLVGAFPFDRSRPARLGLSDLARYAAPTPFAVPWPPSLRRVRWSRRTEDVVGYRRAVARVLDRMAHGDLYRVVLGRTIELIADQAVSPGDLLAGVLAGGAAPRHAYAVDLGGRTLLGSGPALLVAQHNGVVFANPLTGWAPRDPDPVRDDENATALLRSAFCRREHRMAVDAAADRLAPLCRGLSVSPEPDLLRTGTMWHLSSRITAASRGGGTALDVALALHSDSPVVGGPSWQASEPLAELESFDREFFSGMVGWTDSRGNGEWMVTSQCAEMRGELLRLFAASDVLPGSTPDSEVAATDIKFHTILRALQAA